MDTYITHNPAAPWNQKETEPLTELEELQEYNSEMIYKLKKAKEDLQYCIELSELGKNVLLTKKLKAIRL